MEELMRAALTNALTATALAAVAAGLALILARRPAIVHCIWVVVLLKLVTPPLFEVSVARFVPEPTPELVAVSLEDLEGIDWEAVETYEPVEVVEAAAAPAWEFDPTLAWKGLGALWLAGSLATALLAGVRIARFQRRLRDASPAGWAVEEEVAALAAEMGLRRPPLVDIVDARTTPMLWGLGLRPRLILPRMLWKEMDGRSRTLLLTHELAHLKRGDHLLRFLELAVTVLYWWLPVVWLVRRALRDVEEQCCDAWVVWIFPDDARAYAETLLDTVDFLNPGAEPEPLLASGFGKVHHLRKRLTMVMKGTTPRALGWKGGLAALALSGVLLPMSPTWAQKAADDSDSDAATTATVTATASASADGETSTVIVSGARDGSPDVVTFRVGDAVAFSGSPITVKVDNEKDLGSITADSVAFWSDAKSGDAKTITGRDGDKDEKDARKDKDKGEKDGDRKDKPTSRNFRYYEFRGTPAEAREGLRKATDEFQGAPAEGLKKATDELKARIKELEAKKGESPEAEAQIKALKAALEQIENKLFPLGRMDIQAHPRSVDPKAGEGRKNEFRVKMDDPKALEARKQVEELRKVLVEKQKEMSEAAQKLAKAQAELSKLSHEFVRIHPDVNLRLKELRATPAGAAPRIAEGRAIVIPGPDSREKARIDALEQKLDKVLKQLEGLKKPESDSDKK